MNERMSQPNPSYRARLLDPSTARLPDPGTGVAGLLVLTVLSIFGTFGTFGASQLPVFEFGMVVAELVLLAGLDRQLCRGGVRWLRGAVWRRTRGPTTARQAQADWGLPPRARGLRRALARYPRTELWLIGAVISLYFGGALGIAGFGGLRALAFVIRWGRIGATGYLIASSLRFLRATRPVPSSRAHDQVYLEDEAYDDED